MADPTRQQFDAAAKKVAASAPPGLSKEQFYALIDKELAAQSYKPDSPLLHQPNATDIPAKEPDTYWGGFIKGLKDYYRPAAKDVKEGLVHMAHPQDKEDFAGLLLPSVGVNVGGDILDGFKAFGRSGSRAMQEAKNLGGSTPTTIARVPKLLMKTLGEEFWKPELTGPKRAPLVQARYAAENPMAGSSAEVTVPPDPEAWRRQPTPGGPLTVQPTGTEPIASASVGRLTGNKAPMLDDELMKALEEARGSTESPTTASIQPSPSITDPTTLHQSGKFGKSGSIGQAGGYSSGRPAVTGAGYDELQQVGGQGGDPLPAGNDSATLSEGGKAVESPSLAPDNPASIEEVLTGDSLSAPDATGKPKLSAPEVAAMLRRMFGSRDASRMLYGSGGDTLGRSSAKDAITRLAPGPSQIPLTAEERIQEALRKAQGK